MGYYARGYGNVTLKNDTNLPKLKEVLQEICKGCSEMEFGFSHPSDGTTEIVFSENDTHWHEEVTQEFLNALIPYAIEGYAIYDGEDGCYWRYRLVNRKWIDESGQIFYNVEDMIKKLNSKGYTVTPPERP